jgi:hypothetical protein
MKGLSRGLIAAIALLNIGLSSAQEEEAQSKPWIDLPPSREVTTNYIATYEETTAPDLPVIAQAPPSPTASVESMGGL